MYEPVTAIHGVQAVAERLYDFQIERGPDGLTLREPAQNTVGDGIVLPPRLSQWLVDLRLLRHVPLAYLVPDPALLPIESIRFFHVDPTWVDRLVDGVFAAANLGTVDAMYSYAMLRYVRQAVDDALVSLATQRAGDAAHGWTPGQGLTGMLIRSELVRRWPQMQVEALGRGQRRMPVLRNETLAPELLIALFAGDPDQVTVSEPFSGSRLGVERRESPDDAPLYQVDRPGGGSISVRLRAGGRRALDLARLAREASLPGPPSSARLALHLQQRPYKQVFTAAVDESRGSVPVDAEWMLRHGRVMNLDALRQRGGMLAELEKP